MSKMIFYPQGVNPQGLQKVCFCCNSGDFDRCFEALRQDLFGAVKDRPFVLCRDETPDAPAEEELFLNLGEMKLFAVPVTYRFLTESSRARDVDIPFALEHHIPVLPILFDSPEPEILEAYGKVFGELQFLYKYESDPTSIPYGEKLKKYLSDRILDDETAKKIRGAFDAYIFLSYRKKDRKYAKELMRLIHENPLCRDLAIWYDEFLTPGENFNETIASALDKSALFALAVTPNLVNEINYVMTTEYPMARDGGKPILPAELVPTDGALLKEKYGGIADPVDARSAALSEGLMARLASVALRKNDSDPLHNFFIGLAYLSGVDVEIDHEKAVSLITSAAEANLPEAMEKLAAMYRDGEGVARDYDAYFHWLNQLQIYYRGRYQQTGSDADAESYASALDRLCREYRDFRRYGELRSALWVLTHFCESFCKTHPEHQSMREKLADAYFTEGEYYISMGDNLRAKEVFERSVKLREEILSGMPGRESHKMIFRKASYLNHAQTLFFLGQATQTEEDSVAAEAYHCRGVELMEQYVEFTGNEKDRLFTAAAYVNISGFINDPERIEESYEFSKKAVDAGERAFRAAPSEEAKRILAQCYSRMAEVCRLRKDLPAAEEASAKGLALFREVYEQSPVPKNAALYYYALYEYGYLRYLSGDSEEAKKLYQEAFSYFYYAAEGVKTPYITGQLAKIYEGLGDVSVGKKKRKYYMESMCLLFDLKSRYPKNPSYRQQLWYCASLYSESIPVVRWTSKFFSLFHRKEK